MQNPMHPYKSIVKRCSYSRPVVGKSRKRIMLEGTAKPLLIRRAAVHCMRMEKCANEMPKMKEINGLVWHATWWVNRSEAFSASTNGF